jgi:1-acyl-sn-glycerol-3-phosphate acyltransferase
VLLNRHWNFYYARYRGASWVWYEYWLFFLPFGYYLAALLKRWRLRWRSPPSQPDFIDADYLTHLAYELLSVLARRYFRAELQGLEKIPEQRPLILLMNHSGMSFPWDFMAFVGTMYEDGSRTRENLPLCPLGEKLYEDHPILSFMLPRGWLETNGGRIASYANFEKLLQDQRIALYAPEGSAGMGKGWARRYHLQRFHTSFVKLAAKYDVPIVPVLCVGAEYLNPWAVNVPWLARRLDVPFFALSPLTLLLLIWPSLSYWAPPVKLRYFVLDPLRPARRQTAHFGEEDWKKWAEEIRQDLQEKLDRLR